MQHRRRSGAHRPPAARHTPGRRSAPSHRRTSRRPSSTSRTLRAFVAPLALGVLVLTPGYAAAPVDPAPAPQASVGVARPSPAAAPQPAAAPSPTVAAPTRTPQATSPARGRGRPCPVQDGCGPLGLAATLPESDLEREDPEELYALVTRTQAVEPLTYEPDDLVDVLGGPYQLRAEAATALEALIAEGAEQGHPTLRVVSGYRSYDTQVGTHQDWVARLGAARADAVSAVPGHSEHQLGLAADLQGACGGFGCFGASPEGVWVAANAHRFGFILRYPEGGEDVTGYAYEGWHLRYVGRRAAWAMHLQGEPYWERFAEVALEAADR